MAQKTLKNWRCPFCGQHTTLSTWEHVYQVWVDTRVKSKHGSQAIQLTFVSCANRECRELVVQAEMAEITSSGPGGTTYKAPHTTWNLRPEANIKQFPDYVPKAILADYREACLVQVASPKASATLSRRCLQGMIRDFWSVRPQKLFQEINAIKDRVDPETWRAIDGVRLIGNVGAHMEHDVNLIVDVEPEEAELLIQLVETLIQDWYINRHERSKRMSALTAAAQKKKEPKRLTAPPALPEAAAEEPEVVPIEVTADP
jgi:hypothetical protein